MNMIITYIKKGLLFGVPAVIISSIIYSITSFLNDVGNYLFGSFPFSTIIYPILILFIVGFSVMKLNQIFHWTLRSTNFVASSIKSINDWIERKPVVGVFYQVIKVIFGLDKEKGHGVFDRPIYVQVAEGVEELGLITHENNDGTYTIFIPGSPNPTSGKIVRAKIGSCTEVQGIDIEDVITSAITVGKQLNSHNIYG